MISEKLESVEVNRNNEIKASPDSFLTAKLSPVELEIGPRKQVYFEGKQVDNPQNPKKNIRGKLVIKRKTKDIDDFSMVEKFSRKDIRNNEFVEIELNTEATYNLAKGLFEYYKLFSGKQTNPFEDVTYVPLNDSLDEIKALLQDKKRIASVLGHLNTDSLNAAINMENLKRIKAIMEENLSNDGEAAFWQHFFEENAWILAQIFHAPVMIFKDCRYIGGKRLDGHGGQVTDYLFKNDLTDNIAIIEIKSPVKSIISSGYRQTFSFNKEFIGAINQLLLQKESLQHNYHTLNSQSTTHFNACNIEAILVYGSIAQLDDTEKEAFERFRNELRSITVITFDELLKKVNNLIRLFSEEISNI